MRATNRLTDTWLRKAKVGNGIYADGASLYLRVQGSARSWLYIYTDAAGKRRELGLGGYPGVSLAIAREKAQGCRDMRARGLDPYSARKAVDVVPTFETVATEWIAVNEPRWSGKDMATMYRGYVKNWTITLNPLHVDKVDKHMIASALKPVWGTPTGGYLRSFIERVLEYSMVKGHRPEGLNPARLKGNIEVLLHARPHVTKHHVAMPWEDVPALMARLEATEGVVPMALRLTILCAMRQLECRELRWREVQDDRIVIPASRYKTRRDHVIPLNEPARLMLVDLRRYENDPDALVFPGRIKGRPFSSHEMAKYLPDHDPHGFRSSFAVWAVESGGFTDEIAQRCLGHLVGSAVTRAYQRSDFFEQKQALFDAWGSFVTTRPRTRS